MKISDNTWYSVSYCFQILFETHFKVKTAPIYINYSPYKFSVLHGIFKATINDNKIAEINFILDSSIYTEHDPRTIVLLSYKSTVVFKPLFSNLKNPKSCFNGCFIFIGPQRSDNMSHGVCVSLARRCEDQSNYKSQASLLFH